MQLATADQVASEATLLSREQLQFLTQAAHVLGREVEEITSDVINYVQQLQGSTPAALVAATCDAIQQWMDRAAGAEAVAARLPTAEAAAGLPTTRSGRSELDRRMAVLAKKQAALQLAIRQGRENPVDRAIRIPEGALGDVVVIIEAQATEEDWPAARRQERLREVREPVEALVRMARATKRDAAVSAWANRMRALADEVPEAAKQILEDQSEDYTLDEVDEELAMLTKRGQQVREHLEAGRRDGFDGHPEFEQAQLAVLGEIQAQVTGVETWLEEVRNNLYTAAVAVQQTRAVDRRRDRVDLEPVPVRVIPATQLPSQAASMRSMVQSSLEWLANTIAVLGVSRGSRPAAGAAGPPEQVDALALLSRTQALTSQSLQQVAEGLTRWTDSEMKHRSKDWLVFDGQVIHHIAWKREWRTHHQENYLGLQGDTLRRVLVYRCLRPADRERVRYRSTVAQVWEYLDRAYQRQYVFLHDLMKPVLAHKEIDKKNYQALEEYLDLLIRTFDIAEEAGMLPVVLHMNNLRPIYEKWPHGEQAK
jgi:hypothetical protein